MNDNMDRSRQRSSRFDLLGSSDLDDISKREDVPTEYESFLLSLCGVSSGQGFHHALRAGYGYGNDPLYPERGDISSIDRLYDACSKFRGPVQAWTSSGGLKKETQGKGAT